MSSMEIKIMDKAHISEVMEIDKRCFPDPWSEKSFIDEMENENTVYLVAYDDIVLGYAGMWCVFENADITNIAVSPDARRKGIGASLVAELIRYAEEKNADNIRLEVRNGNAAAISLYKKCGFTQVGLRKKYYSDNGEDALIMERKI